MRDRDRERKSTIQGKHMIFQRLRGKKITTSTELSVQLQTESPHISNEAVPPHTLNSEGTMILILFLSYRVCFLIYRQHTNFFLNTIYRVLVHSCGPLSWSLHTAF